MKKLFLMIIVICSIGWYIPETSASDTLWYVAYYSNKFGEPTQEKYVTHVGYIHGTFSNSAVQNAPLNVKFLIDETSIAIMLYEYAGNNPVKVFSKTKYNVFFQDKNGHCGQYFLSNWSDRIVCPKTIDPCNLHNALMKGGVIKFVIRESKYPINIYKFTIRSKIPLSKTKNYIKAYREEMEIGTYAKAYKEIRNN